MKVIVCKVHGFCAGVSRALSLAKMQLAKGEGLSILGPLVHNEEVGKKLEEKGAQIFSKDEKDFAKSLLSAPKDVVYSFAQVQIARSFSAQGLCWLPRPFGAGRAGRGNSTIGDGPTVPLFSHPRGREVRGG